MYTVRYETTLDDLGWDRNLCTNTRSFEEVRGREWPGPVAVLWIRIRIILVTWIGGCHGSGSASASNKNPDPDPHPYPYQGDKSNPDLHPDPHQGDPDPQHCPVVCPRHLSPDPGTSSTVRWYKKSCVEGPGSTLIQFGWLSTRMGEVLRVDVCCTCRLPPVFRIRDVWHGFKVTHLDSFRPYHTCCDTSLIMPPSPQTNYRVSVCDFR